MEDLFARIGRALELLTGNSTLNGEQREECVRLATELQQTDETINRIVSDRVQAAADDHGGRLAVLEQAKLHTDTVVFSKANLLALEASGDDEEELANIRRVFNGADPALFDHDGDGAAGGSEPAPATDDPAQMTIAQATAWLDENSVDHKGVTKVADLRDLVAASQKSLTTGQGSETVSGVG